MKSQRNNRQKASAWIPPMEKWRKGLYFHYTVKIQQPHPMMEPKKRMGKGNVLEKWGAPLRFPSLSLSLSLFLSLKTCRCGSPSLFPPKPFDRTQPSFRVFTGRSLATILSPPKSLLSRTLAERGTGGSLGRVRGGAQHGKRKPAEPRPYKQGTAATRDSIRKKVLGG